MGIINPTQSNPGDTIEADDINTPVNQLKNEINGNIESVNIKDGAITAADLADDSVTTDKIADNTITPPKLSDLDWVKTIFCAGYNSYTGASPTITAADYANGNPIDIRVNTSNQNDELFYKVVLQAGTYDIFMVTDKDINRGVYQLRINSADIGTPFDGYGATRTSQLYVTLVTGTTIATSSLTTISLKATSKNVSSIGYVMAPSYILIVRKT